VSGPGAGAILEDEGGLHVLETVGTRDGDTEIERIAVSAEIVGASPGEPVGERDVVAQAVIGLDSVELPGPGDAPLPVRAERPLVRDTVRGYRTGRTDRVLAGDFDLYGA